MIHRDIDNQSNSIGRRRRGRGKERTAYRMLERKSPLVVVKYFRRLSGVQEHPSKVCEIAEREFSNVLFLKVNLSEFDDSSGGNEYDLRACVQVYNGAEGLVSESSLNLMPKSLRNFRNILDAYTSCVDNLPKERFKGQLLYYPRGWRGIYSGQMKYLASVKETLEVSQSRGRRKGRW